MSKALDPELLALTRIGRILNSLDEGGRRRVLLYIEDRYEPVEALLGGRTVREILADSEDPYEDDELMR